MRSTLPMFVFMPVLLMCPTLPRRALERLGQRVARGAVPALVHAEQQRRLILQHERFGRVNPIGRQALPQPREIDAGALR